jgi:hypothetical protein
MADFCILFAGYNRLVRRGRLIMIDDIEGTHEVLSDLQRLGRSFSNIL